MQGHISKCIMLYRYQEMSAYILWYTTLEQVGKRIIVL